MAQTKTKNFYGWKIVVCCFLISMFAMGIISNTISFYMKPVCETLGCSYVQFSFINVVSCITSMLAAILLAPKIEGGNVRMIMLVSAAAAGLGFGLQGMATHIWHFYVLFGITNLGIGGLTSLPINYLITNWFKDKKGLATSLAFSGAGIGGIFWSPAVSAMIGKLGWRSSLFLSGAAVVIVSVLACLFIRKTPAEMGQEPYTNRDSQPKETQKAARAPAWEGVTRKTAVASPAFWVFVLSLICMGMLAAGVMTQVPTYFSEIGLSYAGIMALFSGVSILGNILGGMIFDKLGLMGGMAFTCICNALALVCLLISGKNTFFAYLFAAAIGMGMVISMLGPPLMTSGLFGTKEYARIYSISNAFFLAGCMIGPMLSSGLRTATGSYTAAWSVYIAISICCFVFAFLAHGLSRSFKNKGYTDNI